MTRANNPFEVGLEKFCALDGPDFVGKAALQRIAAEGPARRLCGIRMEGARAPACTIPWTLSVGGEQVGRMPTAVWSARFESTIGFAMMERGWWEPGTEVEVLAEDGSSWSGRIGTYPFEDTAG